MLHDVMVYLCVSSSQNPTTLDILGCESDKKKSLNHYSVKKLESTTSLVHLNWFGEILAQFTRFFFLKNRFIDWLGKKPVICMKNANPSAIDVRISSIHHDFNSSSKSTEVPLVEKSPPLVLNLIADKVTEKSAELDKQTISTVETNVSPSLGAEPIVVPHTQESPKIVEEVIKTSSIEITETIPSLTQVLRDINTKFRPLTQFFTKQYLVLKENKNKEVQTTFQRFFTQKTKEEQALATTQSMQLKDHLLTKYGADFKADGWHGYTSLGRLIWQDEKFITMVSANPLILVAFIVDEKEFSETSLGGILLAGPGRQEIAYLATVAPNWRKVPKNFTWDLHVMALTNPVTEETPFQPNLEFLNQFQKMMEAISLMFVPKPLEENPVSASMAWVENASIPDLLAKYEECVSTTVLAQTITYSSAGNSTLPWNMAEQCFEVMYSYKQIYEHHKNDTDPMGYGLVSHALDVRHLAAALYFVNNQESLSKEKPWRAMFNKNREHLLVGIQNFKHLIERMQGTTTPSTDCELFKIRLQQLLKLTMSKQ